MFQPVYLDHNATTPLDPAVFAAMLPWLESQFGNPSSRRNLVRLVVAHREDDDRYLCPSTEAGDHVEAIDSR